MDALLDLKLKPWKKGHVSPVDCSKFPAGNCTTIFNPTSLVGSVGTIQSFTVPVNGTYRIEVWGAQGGRVETGNEGFVGGLGARMRGDFSLDPGTVLSVLVGQQGTSNSDSNSGGGGGSFVVRSDNSNPLIIAGGGGGIRVSAGVDGGPGLITTTAGDCTLNPVGVPGGVPGSDGKGGGVSGAQLGSGGGGFIENGADDTPWGLGGQAFRNGGNGGEQGPGTVACRGVAPAPGGFGGGGAGNGCFGGGGGGGYSGGPGCWGAGGGGSFNEGLDPSNSQGLRSGAGLVTITYVP